MGSLILLHNAYQISKVIIPLVVKCILDQLAALV